MLYIVSISLDTVYYNNHFFSFMTGLEALPAKRPRIDKSKAAAMECDESDVLKIDESYMKPVDGKKNSSEVVTESTQEQREQLDTSCSIPSSSTSDNDGMELLIASQSSKTMPKYGLGEGTHLREYQKELAAPGLRGENYIICAPTGTGKTLVAARIIVDHLEKHLNSEKFGKVIFITPNQSLTVQQRNNLNKYVDGTCTEYVTGRSDGSIRNTLDDGCTNIIVCTAGKLHQELRKKDVSICDFTLIIADECHHATRQSNYCNIMEFYLKAKYEGISGLPQIIGMTASPGAGRTKKPNIRSAISHQMHLCATLDAKGGIQTVSNNVEEMKYFQNSPECFMEFQERRDSTEIFIRFIMEAISRLEYQGSFNPSVRCIESQAYQQWISDKLIFEKQSVDSNTRDTISILDMLLAYSKALETYNDFRKEDALEEIKGIELCAQETETEKILHSEYQELLQKLTDAPHIPNPVLDGIKKLLLKQYQEYPNTRGIFFVQEINHAKYIVSWMTSCPELMKHVCVEKVTGYSRRGMTLGEQTTAVERFRNDDCNMLVSTSVAEEGLDIPECNFIIRFKHTSNEIAEVQTKGRARAKDSTIHTILTLDSRRTYLALREKENVASSAIQSVRLSSKFIEESQKDFLTKREKARNDANKRKIWPCSDRVMIQCIKCKEEVCRAVDIYTYGIGAETHYVVPNKSFADKFIKTEHDPDKKEVPGEMKKPFRIHCKKCRNKWGIFGVWPESRHEFPVLKCEQLRFILDFDTNPKVRTHRKWKDVPFQVQSYWECFEDDVADD